VVLGWLVVAWVQTANGASLTVALIPDWKNAVIAAVLAALVSVVTAWLPIWRTVRLSAIQALYHQF